MNFFRQTWEIFASAIGGCIVVALTSTDMIVPVFAAHIVFCGYLGWRRARG